MKCIDCFNFKTKVVTIKTLNTMYHKMRASFIRKVEDTGGARIWWCSKSQLPHSFYTEKSYIEQLRKEDCKCGEF